MKPTITTTFGNLFKDFDLHLLPDVAFFQEGPGLRKWQWTDEGMKVINVTNIIGDGSVDVTNTSRYISLEEYNDKYQHFSVDDGDIVLASSGNTYGKIGRINKSHLPLMMNTSVIRFRPHDPSTLNANYLYAFLRSSLFLNQVESFVIGSAQPNFGPSHLKRMKIPVPPIATQRKIASILSAYDDLIENNTRRIAILEEMAQAIYREWFVHFRFPGHTHVKLVDSPLGPIPEGWEVAKFTDIADVLSGGTPKTKNSEYWNGDIPFFTPRDCPDGFFVLSTARSVTEKGVENCSSANFPERSIFITARGTVGKTVLTPCNMAMSQSCYAIKPKFLPQEIAFLMLRSSVEELKARTHGAVFDTIIKDTFKQIQIALAPQTTALEFQERVQSMFDEILILYKKNRLLCDTRDLLLPKLISGKLDVEDLDIDVGLTTEAVEEATA